MGRFAFECHYLWGRWGVSLRAFLVSEKGCVQIWILNYEFELERGMGM